MLKKINRLRSNRAFKATYLNNHKLYSDLVIVYLGKEKQDPNTPTRVGFVVSKKIHKRAVKRNKIKRIMREYIRQNLTNYPLDKYQSLVFCSLKGIEEKTNDDIRKSMFTLLNKIQ